ncbi:Peptidyl-prolyl cis-trans isomerase pin4 [Coemansia sp. RSA 2399]|nr:Peptidyl-prolyl cis-trans isomerase pin4 [Coemansia sp. RSA 2399]
MSKAIQETLKKLEQTTISEPTTAAAAPSSSSSASSSPQQRDVSPARSANDADSLGTAPVVAPGADQSVGDDSVLGRGRNRRIVQSMYGAPPGYNATMGVGGGREALGRGRVGSGRQRNSIMVPDQLQAAMHPQSMVPMAPLQTPVTRLTGAEYALMANMPDDAIPNAIVVKNINFAIKREELLQTIADLGLPLPYAFNYHFDNGVFRGLAFGNFRTPEEAARVIVGLNGLSLLGRPLKVEYKKALPGTAPPPHPNTIAMMNSASGAPMGAAAGGGVESQNGGYGGALSAGNMQSNNQQYDRPIPRPRRNQNGDASERPRSMMVFPSSMPIPDTSPSNQHQMHQNNAKSPSPNNDTSSMIDLDDEATRTLYDVVSHFRHDKSIAELEFPCSLNTKQRQTIMLIAERFGINHETKSDANGRYIRVYKGLNTLLEGTEVRRRSMASPSTGAMTGGSQTMRYGSSSSQGRSRPSSMLYPDSLSMGGMASPPPQQQQQQQQRMNSYHQPQSYQQHQDPMRMRSFTHSQAGAMSQFNGAMQYQQQQQQTQQYQTTQQFTRTSDNQNRASGNYGGYPSRLYQDSVVVPIRHPRGPDMSQNFAGRQQMYAQEERHAQRQVQLKVLQQIRQRRLSSAGEDGSSAPATPSAQPAVSGASNGSGSSASSSAGTSSVFRIGKPGSKAIPIVRPKEEEDDDDEEGDYELVASPGSSLSQLASPKASSPPSSSSMAAGQRQEQVVGRDSQ